MGDNQHVHGDDVGLSDHNVVASGCYGYVSWTVCSELYGVLNRDTRDELLEMVAERLIHPYMVEMAKRLLRQAGCGTINPETLDSMWSDETHTIICIFGQVQWLLSQGLWNTLPADQRGDLCNFAGDLIHDFFGGKVYAPMMRHVYGELQGD